MTNFFSTHGDILHLYCFGDQHHETSRDLKVGKKVLSDGGSNIHTHLLLFLKEKFSITIFTYQDNYQVRNFFGDAPSIRITEFPTLSGLFKRYLLHIEILTRCLFPGLFFLFRKLNYRYVITQTDFLPDTFAALCLKLRNPKIRWIASFFLTAPAPWDKQSPYRRIRWIIGFFYWLQQQPSILFIRWKADKIIVTSEPDANKFFGAKHNKTNTIIIQGGVDLQESETYKRSVGVIPIEKRIYDACFVGRFHYQKGVVELIEIWEYVCRVKKDARLAIIGTGPLEAEVKEEVTRRHLEGRIQFVGFKDGPEKFKIFTQSKIMVHPATYDSGGMAMAAGMAFGLPGVSFDLESLRTYYPQGVLKTPIGNKKQFAQNILHLLQDTRLYETLSREAYRLIVEVWDWNKRLQDVSYRLFPDQFSNQSNQSL